MTYDLPAESRRDAPQLEDRVQDRSTKLQVVDERIAALHLGDYAGASHPSGQPDHLPSRDGTRSKTRHQNHESSSISPKMPNPYNG